ncbi:MAG: lysophospholipid acyltransferase family protein [Roseobacter sp.]
MSSTWYGQSPPPRAPKFNAADWFRLLMRGFIMVVVVFGGLGLLLLIRFIERPLFGERRPVTPNITVFVCQIALRILRLKVEIEGKFEPDAGAVVANHSSWLDIFVLNAVKRVYFVSKSEVSAWPGIGWLARATGTVFVERKRARAAEQAQLFRERLAVGHRLLFFPEGTSSDGQTVLPFKTTLFAAFFTEALRDNMSIQPVSVVYQAPKGCDKRWYAWWGDMDFAPHFLRVLSTSGKGHILVTYHKPLHVADFSDRKVLAKAAFVAVRSGHAADSSC